MIGFKLSHIAMFAALSVAIGVAHAQNAHFVGQVRNQGIQDTSDIVSGKIAGLGDNEEVEITASANAAALFACQNNGGNFPSDPKKQTEVQEVSNSVRQSPDNGQVTFSINLGPVPTTLECPGNQVVVLACIEFADKKASFETIALQTGSKDANPSSASVIVFRQFTAECNALFATN